MPRGSPKPTVHRVLRTLVDSGYAATEGVPARASQVTSPAIAYLGTDVVAIVLQADLRAGHGDDR
jgi:hypothetical protein